ncbi:MAG: 16S rRNA (cytidine(1402)-2'-O)-methyltransferase [Actinobacteria bacterium]|nr:16S rRNA (cytidine(1402)-2'-O)-methyltransferase [Actinomycetota bacterium]MBM3697557.1 16S rRNA (cytidine(1402)-2'-O)-methyltransferase [Actinomycetota bacterium]
MSGALVVVATPIGTLEDLSPRAARALRDADVVACEDTRRTAVLLRHAGSGAPMVPAHEHNEARRAADLARRMADGATVVLVSDAGMPGVSDPGARVVAAAVEAGVPVTVIPGAGAVETALVASGLALGAGYAFAGFAPRKAAELRAFVERLDSWGEPVVVFEGPRRVGALLAAIAEHDPDRPVAVCRELTKVHEEVLRGTAADLAARITAPLKGEVAVVVGPPAAPPAPDEHVLAEHMVPMLDAGMSPARAADVVAALGAAPRNVAYRAALAAAAMRDSA